VSSPAELRVNGATTDLSEVPDSERLLDTLRWRLGLKGTKEGCRSGACGSCTVLVNGRSTLSCLTLTREVEGAQILTIEGAGADPLGAKVQLAFETENALQCGYCIPGFVMALLGRLKETTPTDDADRILLDLQGNLCRCTGYASIERAVRRTFQESR
jgi:carbon-monoxide dehydrogenase small subunit